MTDREAIDVLFNEWKCIDRNDGIHCDRKCESCDLVMDVGIIREAFNMAISALQAQADGDCISRQSAIDVLGVFTQADALGHTPKQIVEALPSAQPKIEERKEEFAQNVPKEDLISRKAAIDVMSESLKRVFPEHRQIAEKCLNVLPSAQPDPQWIPISERLPEKYGNYLISIHGEDEPDIGTINPNDKRGWSLCDANGFHWASDKKLIVTAWMPLPEPYREERRTDE